jgi:hypothetical protein
LPLIARIYTDRAKTGQQGGKPYPYSRRAVVAVTVFICEISGALQWP